MKVTRDKEFTPITIVIETEEEAYEMWYKLNTAKKYIKDCNREYNTEKTKNIDIGMFKSFDKVYNPHE